MRDAVATMGTILPDEIKEGSRDAVHVACIAVTSVWHEPLKAGTHVNASGFPDKQQLGEKHHLVGIVDPFLTVDVKPGDTFWLYLYPRTITGLSHQWTHPAFPENEPAGYGDRDKSQTWMQDWCDQQGVNYEVIEWTINHRKYEGGGSFFIGDQELHEEITEEWWLHAQNIAGRPLGKKPEYFRCAC